MPNLLSRMTSPTPSSCHLQSGEFLLILQGLNRCPSCQETFFKYSRLSWSFLLTFIKLLILDVSITFIYKTLYTSCLNFLIFLCTLQLTSRWLLLPPTYFIPCTLHMAKSCRHISILIFLDLSATPDTIDHHHHPFHFLHSFFLKLSSLGFVWQSASLLLSLFLNLRWLIFYLNVRVP